MRRPPRTTNCKTKSRSCAARYSKPTIERCERLLVAWGAAPSAGGLSGAALALTAALLHVFNHSIFKSLLFLGSGAVMMGTGERNMERLGGLYSDRLKIPKASFQRATMVQNILKAEAVDPLTVKVTLSPANERLNGSVSAKVIENGSWPSTGRRRSGTSPRMLSARS